jgi:hypothetical protein
MRFPTALTLLLSFSITACEDEPRRGIPYNLALIEQFSWSTYSVVATVLVTDAFGDPVPGVEVTWRSFDGTAVVTPRTDTTDVAGLSQSEWVAGVSRCTDSLQAAVPGLKPVYSNFTRTEPNAFQRVLSGGNQRAPAGSMLPQPIVVRLETSFGCGRQGGLRVYWKASDGGIVIPIDTVTRDDGSVSAYWRLGPSQRVQFADVLLAPFVDYFVPRAVSATAE